MFLSAILGAFLGLITLDGVTGGRLSARAEFDSNNVRLGDPMELAICFVSDGSADFSQIHPPEISSQVDSNLWRIDDASAKTETLTQDYRDMWGQVFRREQGRKLIYRVRPLKEGVLEFPKLEFVWGEIIQDEDGKELPREKCATKAIPVHVKPAARAALSQLDETDESLPMPDGLIFNVKTSSLADEEAFAWKKAFGELKADSFSGFDFPEAKLNEAALRIIEGDWAKALKIYYSLEWRIGQTKEIERGIIAALSRKTGDRNIELPAWRIAFRPILKYGWKGRLGISLSIVFGVCLFFLLSGHLIKKLAAIAIILSLVSQGSAFAQSTDEVFDQIDKLLQMGLNGAPAFIGNPSNNNNVRSSRMGSSTISFSTTINGNNVQSETVEIRNGQTFVNGKLVEPPQFKAEVAIEPKEVRVGEGFDFILSLDVPKDVRIDQVDFTPSMRFSLVDRNQISNMPALASNNPSNKIIRIAKHVRYDSPYKGDIFFAVNGMYLSKEVRRITMPFKVETLPMPFEIKPLPTENQPEDFRGIIGSGFTLKQTADRKNVSTNDVVRLGLELKYSPRRNCFVPPSAIDGITERDAANGIVKWEEYFIADGQSAVPPATLAYYDNVEKSYKRVSSKPLALVYQAEEEESVEAIAVDSKGEKLTRQIELRIAPSMNSPIIDTQRFAQGQTTYAETETRGDWVRIETASCAGWVKKEDLP